MCATLYWCLGLRLDCIDSRVPSITAAARSSLKALGNRIDSSELCRRQHEQRGRRLFVKVTHEKGHMGRYFYHYLVSCKIG